jgi:hypothetical protein
MVGKEYVREEYVGEAIKAANVTLNQSRTFWETLRTLKQAEERGYEVGYVEGAQDALDPDNAVIGNAGETQHEGWYINADGQRCEAW